MKIGVEIKIKIASCKLNYTERIYNIYQDNATIYKQDVWPNTNT